MRPDGLWTRITSIEQSSEPTLVYNLEVEGNHNYFVGEVGVLSHNCGKTIALGVRENLGKFAKDVGGETWHVWGKESFQTQFLEVINNVNNKINFNLTGPDGEMINVWKAITDPSKATNWELLQLYQNKEALTRTTFYYNGKVIANPFGN